MFVCECVCACVCVGVRCCVCVCVCVSALHDCCCFYRSIVFWCCAIVFGVCGMCLLFIVLCFGMLTSCFCFCFTSCLWCVLYDVVLLSCGWSCLFVAGCVLRAALVHDVCDSRCCCAHLFELRCVCCWCAVFLFVCGSVCLCVWCVLACL